MKIQYLFLVIILFVSCAPRCQLPEGNVLPLNTRADELAPSQKPEAQYNSPCSKEFESVADGVNYSIQPTRKLLQNILPPELTGRVDAVTFTGPESGFFSFAHPPDSVFIALRSNPIAGGVGGTDIIEFYKENGNYKFRALEQPVNSLTWDSHPFAIENNGVLLLIWSSDRADNLGGYSSPFLKRSGLSGGDTIIGNTDLYYAFRSGGQWSQVRNLSSAGRGVNSLMNDETPFIYCLCHNTLMLLASNRGNEDINDFDIYEVYLDVDFENRQLVIRGEPEMLPKGDQLINTKAKEFYPYIPVPYPGDDSNPYLYFASDRFNDRTCSTADIIQNMGEMDIYRFKYSHPCSAPNIAYNVTVLDIEEPGRPLRDAFIQMKDAGGRVINEQQGVNAEFDLDYGREYSFYGGSAFDEIICTGERRVISHYADKQIIRIGNQLIERDTVITYDTLVSGRIIYSYDTTRTGHTFGQNQLNQINEILRTGDNIRIESIETAGDSVKVSVIRITENIEEIDGRMEQRNKQVTITDTIPQFDTSFVRTGTAPIPSERTRPSLNGIAYAPESDTTIYDTVWVYPRYFSFPPCHWEFIHHLDEYRRNVPYFQTGFWEVNTPENLREHLNLLDNDRYDNATFIELHPENQYFGHRRYGLSDEQKEIRRQRRANRIAEYRQFARAVDENLEFMAGEVTGDILPALNNLNELAAGMNNKVIVRIEGWSDIRPIEKGTYLGTEKVEYISGNYDEVNNSLELNPVEIQPGVSLVGELNDTLSKLRAYFGYKELLAYLQRDSLFNSMLSAGRILLADETLSESEFRNRMEVADVIFLIMGRQIDVEQDFRFRGYVGKEGDYRALDPVRRINVILTRVQYNDGRINKSNCCSDESNEVGG